MCPQCFIIGGLLTLLAMLIGWIHKPTGLWLRVVSRKALKKIDEYLSIKGEK